MKISIENAVKGTSEFLANEFSKMSPSLINSAIIIFAQYKLQTQGRKFISMLDDGTGKIDIDNLESLVKKYTSGLSDQSFNTPIGVVNITADTPQKLIEQLKNYGENV